jgi:hypothetical protein
VQLIFAFLLQKLFARKRKSASFGIRRRETFWVFRATRNGEAKSYSGFWKLYVDRPCTTRRAVLSSWAEALHDSEGDF